MKEVNSTYGILIFAILLLPLSFIVPIYALGEEVRPILTITTFLFGILSGFIIASRLSRYSRYRELLTNETGYLITLYNYAKSINEQTAGKMAEVIDKYLIKRFLYKVYEFHERTEEEFHNLFLEVRKIEVNGGRQEYFANQMNNLQKDLMKDREELYLLGRDKIAFWLKTAVILLGGVILYSLFLIRTNEIYSNIITYLLCNSIVIILFLIHDLDKLKLNSRAMTYGIYFRVFDQIGKPRVYTQISFSEGVKPEKDKPYRFGEIEISKEGNKFKEIKTIQH